MRRTSGKPVRPTAKPFALWADFALRNDKGMLTAAQRAAERLRGTSVAVIRTHDHDAPPDATTPEGEPRAKRTRKR
jgi:hypothetical protein